MGSGVGLEGLGAIGCGIYTRQSMARKALSFALNSTVQAVLLSFIIKSKIPLALVAIGPSQSR